MYLLKAVFLLSLILVTNTSHARTIAEYLLEYNDKENVMEGASSAQKSPIEKSVRITVKELQDSQGLKYVGGYVSRAELSPYLSQMQNELGAEFSVYRENQATRDFGVFHMTLVNPYEYMNIDKTKVKFGTTFTAQLKGLGKASKDNKTTYFVVAQSPEAQLYRQTLILNHKDFHVTLGFNPSDIYDVSKGTERIIK